MAFTHRATGAAAMTEELFAYLMDDLPSDRRAEVEAKLAADPAWQNELKRLQECLAANEDPCHCLEEPPANLAPHLLPRGKGERPSWQLPCEGQ